MARYTVEKGKRYRADITLGILQAFASNEMVAMRLRDVGFTDVTVTGAAGTRTAEALWPHEDASAEVPSEITNIRMVA